MNTNLQYAYFQDRYEPYQYHPVVYGNGVWFNPSEETYAQAIERAKQEQIDKVIEDYPHLANGLRPLKKDDTIDFCIKNDLPVIKVERKPYMTFIQCMQESKTMEELKSHFPAVYSEEEIEVYEEMKKKLSKKEVV